MAQRRKTKASSTPKDATPASSAVEQVFKIPELQRLIFQAIDEAQIASFNYLDPIALSSSRQRRSFPQSGHALAALAQTCRGFQEIALNILWERLDTFEPLLRLLPRDVYPSSSTLVLRRPVLAQDWDVLNKYRHRVHFLGRSQKSIDTGISPEVLSTLMNSPHSGLALLPRLQELTWNDNNPDADISVFRRLLHPGLVGLHIAMGPNRLSTLSLLSTLSIFCPAITRFSCTVSSDLNARYLLSILSETISKWEHLENVTTPVLEDRAMSHLATLQSLKSMTLGLQGTPRISNVAFLHPLVSLSLVSNTLPYCTSLLEKVNIDTPILSTRITVPPQTTVIHTFFETLPSHIADTLKHISIVLSKASPARTSSAFRHIIGLEIIRPLFHYRHLQKVNLTAFCASHMDDIALKEMAKAWPQLIQLGLGGAPSYIADPFFTFTGITSLLKRCKHLTNLTLTFDTDTAVSVTAEIPAGGNIVNTNVVAIHVGYSSIKDPVPVAVHLSAIFPNLTSIAISDDDEERDEISRRRAGWDQVRKLLPTFALVRQQGWEQARRAQQTS
ncbi:hypothetical protein BJ138DRAFT_1102715 [Hygrophoropsis aurantiaca]|uniref:Uncharacterized protein n=1 Tax=Hygrophoropsis aurantiaca TaxID=72124 RepID=A0ACB8A9P6_9AGAM|nr:hypothetical protein BJ138DRAFT_1102715 [Hygrophoropsis aurantiaca]